MDVVLANSITYFELYTQTLILLENSANSIVRVVQSNYARIILLLI